MTHPQFIELANKIRDNYLTIVKSNTKPGYDAEAFVAIDADGEVGWEVMETAQTSGLIVVDADDYSDTLDWCFKISDEVKQILLAQVPADRLRAAQEAGR